MKLTPEEIKELTNAQANVEFLKIMAQKAETEYTAAQIITQNVGLKLRIKYKLSMIDGWDADGNIIIVPENEKLQEQKKE